MNASKPAEAVRSVFPDCRSGSHYLIRVVQSGYAAAVDDGKVFLLRPGTALLVLPGKSPRIELLPEAVFLDFYFTAETAELIRSSAPAFSGLPVRVFSAAALEQIVHWFEEISEVQRQGCRGHGLVALEKMLALERLLFQCGESPSAAESKIAVTLLFMAENYSRDITLADLAELIGLSISHYRRCFRAAAGISPIDFLLNLRLFEAEKRLLETGLSVAEIAAETGFGDPNYFSRLFARRKGVPPREWRRTRLKK